jgi:hypothetical protein
LARTRGEHHGKLPGSGADGCLKRSRMVHALSRPIWIGTPHWPKVCVLSSRCLHRPMAGWPGIGRRRPVPPGGRRRCGGNPSA